MNKTTRALALVIAALALTACPGKKRSSEEEKAKPRVNEKGEISSACLVDTSGTEDGSIYKITCELPSGDRKQVVTYNKSLSFNDFGTNEYFMMLDTDYKKSEIAYINPLDSNGGAFMTLSYDDKKSMGAANTGLVSLFVIETVVDKDSGQASLTAVLAEQIELDQQGLTPKQISDLIVAKAKGKTVAEVIKGKLWKPEDEKGNTGNYKNAPAGLGSGSDPHTNVTPAAPAAAKPAPAAATPAPAAKPAAPAPANADIRPGHQF